MEEEDRTGVCAAPGEIGGTRVRAEAKTSYLCSVCVCVCVCVGGGGGGGGFDARVK